MMVVRERTTCSRNFFQCPSHSGHCLMTRMILRSLIPACLGLRSTAGFRHTTLHFLCASSMKRTQFLNKSFGAGCESWQLWRKGENHRRHPALGPGPSLHSPLRRFHLVSFILAPLSPPAREPRRVQRAGCSAPHISAPLRGRPPSSSECLYSVQAFGRLRLQRLQALQALASAVGASRCERKINRVATADLAAVMAAAGDAAAAAAKTRSQDAKHY